MPHFLRAHPGASVALLAPVFLSAIARGETVDKPIRIETVVVTGVRTSAGQPNSVEHVTAAKAREQINAVNTEDLLKYTPSLVVRKRHYGDTQDPIATRTSGVGASARNLIYVDGILISSPVGNNNTTASPHFGVAERPDITSIDVLYGPFAAEYAGNSIGAVVNITTAMPDHFEVYADTLGAVQPFQLYATDHIYGTWQLSGGAGDRYDAFAWRFSVNHLDSTGQPLGFVTVTRPPNTSAGGTPVIGAFNDLSRAGAAIDVFGANSIEHQVQDTDTLKLAYDLPNRWQLTYTLSVFHQEDDATAESYIRDAAGTPVYNGSVNFGGDAYNLTPSSFANGVYHWEQTHLAQAASLRSAQDGRFAWEIVATDYAYLTDNQRVPGVALPGATSGGAGTINRLNGTGWYTLDAKGIWRGWADHELSFGAHRDAEAFSQLKYNTTDWLHATAGALATQARGRTATNALWLQDIWSFAPQFKATIGLRYEDWRAYNGLNFSATPPLDTIQPKISGDYPSPKASVAWQPADDWRFSLSWGSAYRMPTVTELYQAITTGASLTSPNPNLRPEHASSWELAAERTTDSGRVRLSLFQEFISNALLSQSAPLVPGSTTLFNFVQNVPRTRARGVELAFEQRDFLFDRFELSGGFTYSDAHTIWDPAFPAAIGKYLPQVPKLRATLVGTYRPDDVWSFTLAGRYSDRSFGTIDNSDPESQTYQGFAGYFVLDARVQARLDGNWIVSVGVDNFNNDKYFLFHPFPQRTFLMEIHYAQ